MMKAIQKSSENTNTKTKTMTKTTTKTKTQKKCLKHPTYAIFLKSWWLTHSKYDDRYLTLVILFTPVTLITLVTLFQPYIQFYRAECITVSGFLTPKWKKTIAPKYAKTYFCCWSNIDTNIWNFISPRDDLSKENHWTFWKRVLLIICWLGQKSLETESQLSF